MGTVDKALQLLRCFAVQTPEWRLSELARQAGYDKTTTLRCMNALMRNGFVEQEPDTRKYRLGVAPVSLARVREQSFPVQVLLQPYLNRLAQEFEETAHASLLAGGALVNVATAEPHRATRVHVDPSIPLPIHATASGLAVLAFTRPENREAVGLSRNLLRFTAHTTVSEDRLAAMLERICEQGFARADRTFDNEVAGVAVPLTNGSGLAVGSVALAVVATRFEESLGRRVAEALLAAGPEISRQLGQPANGTVPGPREVSAVSSGLRPDAARG